MWQFFVLMLYTALHATITVWVRMYRMLEATFLDAFSWKKIWWLFASLNFTNVCLKVSNLRWTSTGSGNGMEPVWHQPLTLTNDDQVDQCVTRSQWVKCQLGWSHAHGQVFLFIWIMTKKNASCDLLFSDGIRQSSCQLKGVLDCCSNRVILVIILISSHWDQCVFRQNLTAPEVFNCTLNELLNWIFVKL